MNTKNGLYMGRYLIAVYDKNDRIISVGGRVSEVNINYISRHLKHPALSYSVHLIDCFEKHDDVFAEEDKIFLQELHEETKQKRLEKEYNTSRTFYRRKEISKEREL